MTKKIEQKLGEFDEMKEKEQDFYKNYYENIKKLEKTLLSEICEILHPINQQSETKLIEHITSRIKSPESVTGKLKHGGHEMTEESALTNLCDIVGIRLVVHFISDIYIIRNLLVNCGKLYVVKEKDYVKKAKTSGYRGYHIIVEREVDGILLKAEIQIRTIAMDCWASLEHQLRYKKVVKNESLIDMELKKCSDNLMSADIAMEQILGLVKESTPPELNKRVFFKEAMECAAQII